MSYARTLRRAAQNVFQSFTYYVDPVSGSDSAAGLRSAPFATLTHALATATAGQSVGIKRGTTTRTTSTITSALSDVRIGAYGVGAKPIITGGTLVTGWGAVLTGGSTVPLASSGSSGGCLSYAFNVKPVGGTAPTVVQSVKSATGAGTLASTPIVGNTLLYAAAWPTAWSPLTPPAGFTQLYNQASSDGQNMYIGIRTVQAGDGKTWTGTTATNAPRSCVVAEVTNWGGIDQQVSGNIPGNGPYTLPALTPTIANTLLFEFAENTDGTNPAVPSGFTSLQMQNSTFDALYSFTKANPTPGTATGAYSASLTTAPAGTPGIVVADGVALTKGTSTAVTSGQWFWASNTLYVNTGGAPTVVEVAAVTDLLHFATASQRITLRNLDVRFAVNDGLSFTATGRFIVDGCAFKYCVYTSNSGTILIQNCTGGGRIVRCTFDALANDGIWGHNTANVEIAYNTMTDIGFLTGDVQSDGIQWEDTFSSSLNSTGLWVHHNTITLGAASPKGCIIVNADPSLGSISAVVEHNTCTGGNYGIAPHANNTTVRYNTCTGQVSTFGGNIHIDSSYVLDNIQIYRNLLVNSGRSGIVVQDGANNRTNFVIANNTIVNSAVAQIYVGSPISGKIVNNILWWTVQPTLRTLYVLSVVSGQTLTVDYNDLGTAFTSYLRDGSNQYSTLAAWRTATSRDTHSIEGDPSISSPLYIPAGGSPALNSGTAVSPITDGYSGSAPDMGYQEAA